MKHSESLERAATRRTGPPLNRWSDADFKEQRDLDLKPESISNRQVLVAVALCLMVAALLSSGRLVESAERRSFGSERDLSLAVARPIDRLANALSLNRPADAIAAVRAGESESPEPPVAAGALPSSVPSPPPSAPKAVTDSDETEVDPGPIRTVTETQPLKVLVVGDSQAEFPGQALTNRAVKGKVPYEVEFDSRIATGLARPDYFDWPARLSEVDATVEAVVMFFGGNDYQDMEVDGQRLVRGTEDWLVEYRTRIDSVLDVLAADGRRLFWIANPPVRDGDTSKALASMNGEVRASALEREWVTVLAADARFAPAGNFSAYLPDSDGVDVRVRSGDGVHLTGKGASWVADMIVAEVARHWAIAPGS